MGIWVSLVFLCVSLVPGFLRTFYTIYVDTSEANWNLNELLIRDLFTTITYFITSIAVFYITKKRNGDDFTIGAILLKWITFMTLHSILFEVSDVVYGQWRFNDGAIVFEESKYGVGYFLERILFRFPWSIMQGSVFILIWFMFARKKEQSRENPELLD